MPHLYDKAPVKYIAAEKLWDGVSIREAGAEFEFEGRPNPAMLPTCAEGVKRSTEAREWEKTGYLKNVPTNEPQDDVAQEAKEAAIKKAAKMVKTPVESDLA